MKKQKTHEIRRGMLVARIAYRKRKGVMNHRLEVYRLFRNGDRWQRSRQFSSRDIPLLRLLLNEAYGWILLQQNVEDRDARGQSVVLKSKMA